MCTPDRDQIQPTPPDTLHLVLASPIFSKIIKHSWVIDEVIKDVDFLVETQVDELGLIYINLPKAPYCFPIPSVFNNHRY